MKRILIMGLPGAGKTTLSEKLRNLLEANDKKVIWLNADRVRREYDDWDFSREGRIRQSKRMYELSTRIECDFVIADFVAPMVEMREIFQADFTIWMDTIVQGRFADTNSVFNQPLKFDLRIQDFNYNIDDICQFVLNSQKAK